MPSRSRVGEILIKAKVIDDLQLRSAKAQHDQWGGRLGKIVADMGLADEDTIVDAICKAQGMQRMSLGHLNKDAAALGRIDVKMAEEFGIFPVALKDNGKTLVIAMSDPTDLDIVDQISSRAHARLQTVVAGETEIAHAIMRYYKGQDPGAAAAPRARKAVRRATEEIEEEQAGGDEFKVTDMSGKTMIKHIADLQGGPTDPAGAPVGQSASRPGPPVAGSAVSAAFSAGDLLDDMLAPGGAASTALSAEEQARLDSLRVNQGKSTAIVRAVMQLLVEKGYLTQKDLSTRVKL